MIQEVDSLKCRLTRLGVAGLIVVIIFSFSPDKSIDQPGVFIFDQIHSKKTNQPIKTNTKPDFSPNDESFLFLKSPHKKSVTEDFKKDSIKHFPGSKRTLLAVKSKTNVEELILKEEPYSANINSLNRNHLENAP